MQRNKIDLVIPTMWRPENFISALLTYVETEAVGRIILVDNDPSAKPKLPEILERSVVFLGHGKNIFVNPAWNLGVASCTSEVICIANDDISIAPELFRIMADFDWGKEAVDIIGISLRGGRKDFELSRVTLDLGKPLGKQHPNFGACMFMPRKNYVPIPNHLRVWFGDDFLVRSNTNVYKLQSKLVTGAMGTTIKSSLRGSEIRKVINQDIRFARKTWFGAGSETNRDDRPAGYAKKRDESKTTSIDLGCGENPRNPFKAHRVVGIDSFANKPGILACWIGFEPLPIPDSSVDFVTAFDFIEHLPRFALRDKPFNPFIETMNEIWRILKPRGLFLAKTPAYPSAAAFQDPTHVNIITDQTVSYFSNRPCADGTFIDPWGLGLGRRYGFKGEFLLEKQWWEATHLWWKLSAVK